MDPLNVPVQKHCSNFHISKVTLIEYIPGNHPLFSAAKNLLGAGATGTILPRPAVFRVPWGRLLSTEADVELCRMQKRSPCIFQLPLGSDAAVPTFFDKPHLKQVPTEKKNLPGYLNINLFGLVEENLGLKRQRASELKSLIGNVWESKLPWK